MSDLTENDTSKARINGIGVHRDSDFNAAAQRSIQTVRQALERHVDLKAALIGFEGEWRRWEGALNAEQAARWWVIERESNLDGQANSFWTYVMSQVQRLLREDTHAAE